MWCLVSAGHTLYRRASSELETAVESNLEGALLKAEEEKNVLNITQKETHGEGLIDFSVHCPFNLLLADIIHNFFNWLMKQLFFYNVK